MGYYNDNCKVVIFIPKGSGMTNEEGPNRRTIGFLNLGQMAGKTLFTAWHIINYDVKKV